MSNTLTKTKSINSTNSVDRCESDSREVNLNGFNRFDPKYISIGPKALRESIYGPTNINKCATLRHGGRYGGSLIERGSNPVLKKASPPSVATVSKEFNVPDVMPANTLRTAIDNNMRNIYDGSNSSLVGVSSRAFGTEYEKNGPNLLYKRSEPSHQMMKSIKMNDNSSVNNNRLTQPAVYSINAPSYQTLTKVPQHVKTHHSITILNQLSKEDQTNREMSTKQLLLNQSVAPNKISILSQPLPSLPVKTSKNLGNQQLLSASNLDHFRSKSVGTSDEFEIGCTSINRSYNTQNSTEQSTVYQAQKSDQPPLLPPKNRPRNHHTNKSTLKQCQKPPQIQPNIKTVSSSQKPSRLSSNEHSRCASYQQQSTYSTFGFDYDRAKREFRTHHMNRDDNRHVSTRNTLERESNSDETRLLSSNYRHPKTTHRVKENVSQGMVDFIKMNDQQKPESNNVRQYKFNSNISSTNPHRKVKDDNMHAHRPTGTNSRNMNYNYGDSMDLTGKIEKIL